MEQGLVDSNQLYYSKVRRPIVRFYWFGQSFKARISRALIAVRKSVSPVSGYQSIGARSISARIHTMIMSEVQSRIALPSPLCKPIWRYPHSEDIYEIRDLKSWSRISISFP